MPLGPLFSHADQPLRRRRREPAMANRCNPSSVLSAVATAKSLLSGQPLGSRVRHIATSMPPQYNTHLVGLKSRKPSDPCPPGVRFAGKSNAWRPCAADCDWMFVCRDPDLADRRAAKRNALLAAATRELEQVSRMVNPRRLPIFAVGYMNNAWHCKNRGTPCMDRGAGTWR